MGYSYSYYCYHSSIFVVVMVENAPQHYVPDEAFRLGS